MNTLEKVIGQFALESGQANAAIAGVLRQTLPTLIANAAHVYLTPELEAELFAALRAKSPALFNLEDER